VTDGDGPLRAIVSSAGADVEDFPPKVRERLSDALLGLDSGWTDRYVPDGTGSITLSRLAVTNNGTVTFSKVSVSGAGVVFENIKPGDERAATDLTVVPTDGEITITADASSEGGFSSVDVVRQVEPGGTLTLALLGSGGPIDINPDE